MIIQAEHGAVRCDQEYKVMLWTLDRDCPFLKCLLVLQLYDSDPNFLTQLYDSDPNFLTPIFSNFFGADTNTIKTNANWSPSP